MLQDDEINDWFKINSSMSKHFKKLKIMAVK